MAASKKRKKAIPESQWVWYGFAGHYICASQCGYHLCTRVGKRLISTIGRYRPKYSPDKDVPLSDGPNSFFETMIFECDGESSAGDPRVLHWNSLDTHHYSDSRVAGLMHRKLCKDWSCK